MALPTILVLATHITMLHLSHHFRLFKAPSQRYMPANDLNNNFVEPNGVAETAFLPDSQSINSTEFSYSAANEGSLMPVLSMESMGTSRNGLDDAEDLRTINTVATSLSTVSLSSAGGPLALVAPMTATSVQTMRRHAWMPALISILMLVTCVLLLIPPRVAYFFPFPHPRPPPSAARLGPNA